jgi:glutamyl-tRNA reductase
VLVIGLGEVGEATARAAAAAAGATNVVLVNRGPERARRLARELGSGTADWHQLAPALAAADVVFCGTSGEGLLLGEDVVRHALAARPDRPLALVDLAVPRDIDPAVAGISGVTLFNMDDVGRYIASRMGDRRAEVPAVERIVAEEVDRYNLAMAARSVAPLVAALHDRAEKVRQAELARAGEGPWDAAAVDALTRRVVAKLLHDPTVNLKAAAGTTKGDALAEAFRDLFNLLD